MKKMFQKIRALFGRRSYGADLIMAIDLPISDRGVEAKPMIERFSYAAIRTRKCVVEDILTIDTQVGLYFVTVQTSHPMKVMRAFKTVCENMCLSQPVFLVRHQQCWKFSRGMIPGVEIVLEDPKGMKAEVWWSDITPSGDVISLPQCITFTPVLASDTREEDRELEAERAEWEKRHGSNCRKPPVYFDLMEDEVCRQKKMRQNAGISEIQQAGPIIMDGTGIVSPSSKVI